MRITKDKIEDFDISSRREWLIANGIGGFASSTIIGLNTRKYHALLVAALGNDGERYVVLSKLNESIIINNKTYTLSTNQCSNFVEDGYEHQEYFCRSFLPEFGYKINDVEVTKKLAMRHGENRIAVVYTIKAGDNDVTLRLQPLVNFRSFHETRRCASLDYNVKDLAVNVSLNSHGTVLHMLASDGEFEKYDRTYYKNMYYEIEEERGLDAYEDHFMPGAYVVNVPKNEVFTYEFVASVDDSKKFLTETNAKRTLRREMVRLEKICKVAGAITLVEKHLAIAADTFIVEKGDRKTIIAGYPWFGDWGRDTFIAFEGLLLKTNRFKEAKEIILSFSKYVKNGLIPNMIGEDGGSAYNTVDASLWYIDAIHKYYKYTGDHDIARVMYPVVMDIIEAYKNGTEFNIKMDETDGLIYAGSDNTQLTWMDAKVGDKVPTPRYGKPVEINALWYNALKIAEEFSKEMHIKYDTKLVTKVKESFGKFYTDHGLLDVIEPTSNKVRPNQIIAIGLDYSPVDPEKAKDILDVVEEKLYTPQGLKTLSSEHDEYRGYYEGGVYSRDMSYHQGTVWPWLLQFYFEASRKYGGKYTKLEDAHAMIEEGCIGSISEIYDADEPRLPKGAYSQAWSVAMAILNN